MAKCKNVDEFRVEGSICRGRGPSGATAPQATLNLRWKLNDPNGGGRVDWWGLPDQGRLILDLYPVRADAKKFSLHLRPHLWL